MIGFSLGAHVSGFTGQELEGNVSRITGNVTQDSFTSPTSHASEVSRKNISLISGNVIHITGIARHLGKHKQHHR